MVDSDTPNDSNTITFDSIVTIRGSNTIAIRPKAVGMVLINTQPISL